MAWRAGIPAGRSCLQVPAVRAAFSQLMKRDFRLLRQLPNNQANHNLM